MLKLLLINTLKDLTTRNEMEANYKIWVTSNQKGGLLCQWLGLVLVASREKVKLIDNGSLP